MTIPCINRRSRRSQRPVEPLRRLEHGVEERRPPLAYRRTQFVSQCSVCFAFMTAAPILRPCAPKSICSRSQSINASSGIGADCILRPVDEVRGLIKECGFENCLAGGKMSGTTFQSRLRRFGQFPRARCHHHARRRRRARQPRSLRSVLSVCPARTLPHHRFAHRHSSIRPEPKFSIKTCNRRPPPYSMWRQPHLRSSGDRKQCLWAARCAVIQFLEFEASHSKKEPLCL